MRASHGASSRVERQTLGQFRADGAAREFLDGGRNAHGVVDGVVVVGGGVEGNACGNTSGAHHRVNLVEVDGSRVALRDLESVLLVESRVEVAVEEGVGVVGVLNASGSDDGIVGGARVLPAPRQGACGIQRGIVGPNAQANHIGSGIVEHVIDVDGLGGRGHHGGSRRLVEVEGHGDVLDGGGHLHTIRHDGAGSAGDGGRERRQEGVEVHVGGGLLREVNLHGQHRLRVLDLRAGTHHSTVGGVGVTTSGGSGGSDGSVGHVIREDLHTVDVGDNTAVVEEARVVGSHVGNTGEGLAVVLGARGRSSHRAQRDGGPGAVVIGVLSPGAGSRGGHLPLRVLHDGVVQRKGIILVIRIDHHVLEEGVSINALYLDPRTREPRIAVAVPQFKLVLIVRVLGNAVLKCFRCLARKGRILNEKLGTALDREGLFLGVSLAPLDDLDVILGFGTIKRADNSHYSREIGYECIHEIAKRRMAVIGRDYVKNCVLTVFHFHVLYALQVHASAVLAHARDRV